jgi:hypothetical protein
MRELDTLICSFSAAFQGYSNGVPTGMPREVRIFLTKKRTASDRNTVSVLRVVKQKRNKKQQAVYWSVLLSALAVTIGAFATNHQALIAIASTAVIYSMSRSTLLGSISMRGMIIALLGLIVSSVYIMFPYFGHPNRHPNRHTTGRVNAPRHGHRGLDR